MATLTRFSYKKISPVRKTGRNHEVTMEQPESTITHRNTLIVREDVFPCNENVCGASVDSQRALSYKQEGNL